jgi:hypothetical protein
LYALLSLENEVRAYLQAKDYSDLQQSLEPGKWEKAAELALTIAGGKNPGTAVEYEFVNGTIIKRPSDEEPDRPVWQDGDTLHLNTLLAEIRYDSKRLGINVTTIGPNAQGTRALLTRVIGKINLERDNVVQNAANEATKAANEAEQASVLAQYHSLLDSMNRAFDESQRQGIIVQACFRRCAQLPTSTEEIACQRVCQVPSDNASAAFDRACNALYKFQDVYHCLGEYCILPKKPN